MIGTPPILLMFDALSGSILVTRSPRPFKKTAVTEKFGIAWMPSLHFNRRVDDEGHRDRDTVRKPTVGMTFPIF